MVDSTTAPDATFLARGSDTLRQVLQDLADGRLLFLDALLSKEPLTQDQRDRIEQWLAQTSHHSRAAVERLHPSPIDLAETPVT